MDTIETPVLIVGGGGAGLTGSMLLSQLGALRGALAKVLARAVA